MEHGVNVPLERRVGGKVPVPRREGQGLLRGRLPTWPL